MQPTIIIRQEDRHSYTQGSFRYRGPDKELVYEMDAPVTVGQLVLDRNGQRRIVRNFATCNPTNRTLVELSPTF